MNGEAAVGLSPQHGLRALGHGHPIHTAVSHQQDSHSFVQNQIELGNAKAVFKGVKRRRLSPDGKRYALRDFPSLDKKPSSGEGMNTPSEEMVTSFVCSR